MMCDVTNRSFRSQLAAILEKLTKAALAEISNLADECSSVLHTEISQHKSEKEALKKKCYLLEVQLRAAREAQHYPANVNSVSHRQGGIQAPEKFIREQQQQQPAPAIEGVYGKDWCMDLWREDKQTPQSKEVTRSAALRDAGSQAIDLIDGEPDLIFVKEEMYDDQAVGPQMKFSDIRNSVGIIEEDGILHRTVGELRLQMGNSNNFQVTAGGQPQQGSQPTLMDNLIEDSALSSLVSNSNPASATGNYSEYLNNIHVNATKGLSIQLRQGRPLKRFECLFCGKIFNYLSSLKVHIRRHSGEKPFSCTVCGKRFAQKTYLKLHQRVHSGEKPYSCQHCGRSFSQKSSLNIHVRTHTGEKPYSCVDCGKSYAYKYGFNQHQCFN